MASMFGFSCAASGRGGSCMRSCEAARPGPGPRTPGVPIGPMLELELGLDVAVAVSCMRVVV